MSHWDERLRKIQDDKAARADEQRQRQAAEERERRELVATLWSPVLDVTQWALNRFQAAQIRPLPINAVWEVEAKPLFQKPHKENRRHHLGDGYPLLRYNTKIDHENYSEDFEHIVVVTPNREVIQVTYEIARFWEPRPEISEIAINSDGPVTDPKATLGSRIIVDPRHIIPPYAKNLEQVCDWIVEYVGQRAKPGQPIPF